MIAKIPKLTNINSNGDTIVEVLISIAVFGLVLGGAYVTSNRNSLINQASQERLVGSRLAEAQLDLLRSKSSTDLSTFTQNNFCIKGTVFYLDSNDNCKVDSSGVHTDQEPIYKLKITRTDVTNGAVFKVAVTWANVKGTGNDNITYQYGVYK